MKRAMLFLLVAVFIAGVKTPAKAQGDDFCPEEYAYVATGQADWYEFSFTLTGEQEELYGVSSCKATEGYWIPQFVVSALEIYANTTFPWAGMPVTHTVAAQVISSTQIAISGQPQATATGLAISLVSKMEMRYWQIGIGNPTFTPLFTLEAGPDTYVLYPDNRLAKVEITCPIVEATMKWPFVEGTIRSTGLAVNNVFYSCEVTGWADRFMGADLLFSYLAYSQMPDATLGMFTYGEVMFTEDGPEYYQADKEAVYLPGGAPLVLEKVMNRGSDGPPWLFNLVDQESGVSYLILPDGRWYRHTTNIHRDSA